MDDAIAPLRQSRAACAARKENGYDQDTICVSREDLPVVVKGLKSSYILSY
jgi:hypothetical protein